MNNDEIEALPFGGWPLPDIYRLEVGRVTALWSSLEVFRNSCVGKLAGFNEIGDLKPFILVTHASFPQRLDMLGALCEHLAPDFPHLKEHKATITAMRTAQRERNKWAHNSLGPGEKHDEIVMAIGSARGIVKTAVVPVTVADIRRSTIAIQEAIRSLHKLVLQRETPPAPWQNASTGA